ncbi:MAG: hypothetical protein QW750_08480 [Zestosphaera sp.]
MSSTYTLSYYLFAKPMRNSVLDLYTDRLIAVMGRGRDLSALRKPEEV